VLGSSGQGEAAQEAAFSMLDFRMTSASPPITSLSVPPTLYHSRLLCRGLWDGCHWCMFSSLTSSFLAEKPLLHPWPLGTTAVFMGSSSGDFLSLLSGSLHTSIAIQLCMNILLRSNLSTCLPNPLKYFSSFIFFIVIKYM
jgi:hypothetical protein